MELPKSIAKSASNDNQLSPRRAIIVGLIAIASGTYPVLIGVGVARGQMSPSVQPWVVVAIGCMFILAGLAIINGYAVPGRTLASGDLSASAPFVVKLTQYVLGSAIIGLMFVTFAWVAFGSGERHFSSSVSVPGLSLSGHSSERSGRIVFGIAAVLIGIFFIYSMVSGVQRLWRDGVANRSAAIRDSEHVADGDESNRNPSD